MVALAKTVREWSKLPKTWPGAGGPSTCELWLHAGLRDARRRFWVERLDPRVAPLWHDWRAYDVLFGKRPESPSAIMPQHLASTFNLGTVASLDPGRHGRPPSMPLGNITLFLLSGTRIDLDAIVASPAVL